MMDVRKIAVAVFTGAMALSFASCALFGPDKKEIVTAADTFAGALVKQDAASIADLTNGSVNAETLGTLFDKTGNSEDQNEFIKAVGDTLTYVVLEESVEADRERASVDVVFSQVDYEKALTDTYADIGEVKEALAACADKKEVTVRFEFENVNGEWLISNPDDQGYKMIFDFYTFEPVIKLDLSKVYDSSDCWTEDASVYSTVYFTEDVSEFDGDILFNVYYEGTLYEVDQIAEVYGTYICCNYTSPYFNDLPSGEYSIKVKCGDTVVTTMTAVDIYEPRALDDLVVESEWDQVDKNDTYNFYEVGYLGYGDYSANTGIKYYIYFTDELSYDDVAGITYSIYDKSGNTLDEGLTVYGSNITEGTDEQGYYFVYLPYSPNPQLGAGKYYIEVFNPDGTTLLTDDCKIKIVN